MPSDDKTETNDLDEGLGRAGAKVRAAASLVVASMLLTQLVTLGRSVVTARLLTPDDFGLFGMASTVVAALGALTIVSLDLSILPGHLDSKTEDARRRLDVTWTAELFRALGGLAASRGGGIPDGTFLRTRRACAAQLGRVIAYIRRVRRHGRNDSVLVDSTG